MVCIHNCMQGSISNPALPLFNNYNKKKTQLATLERKNSDSLDLHCAGYFGNFSQSQASQEAWRIHNPYLIQEDVTVQGTQPTEDVEDGEFSVEKPMGMHYQEQEEETVSIVNTSKHETSQDDIASAVTFVALLKSCAQKRDLHEGSKLHYDIVKKGLLKKNVFVGSALLNMYAKCGALEKAQEVFDELPFPNIVSWTALIAGYVQYGNGESALKCFKKMQLEGFSPNAVTFACILKACGITGALDKGQEIHAQIGRERLLEQDIVVANALIDMYVKCGALEKAQEVFDELSIRDVISCNSLISGYVQHEHNKEALQLFEWIKLKGFSPNAVTFSSILKACGGIGALDKGQEIHAQIVRESGLENDIVVAGAVVDMYAKCGALKKAQEVFDELPFWNVILWNTLIAGYVQYGHGEEALNCFDGMQIGGFSANAVTLTCILTACGSIGALDKGQESHARIVREHLQEQDIVIANALVDMYAKCGVLERAHQLLIEIAAPDKVSWNVLIAGYVQHGHGEEALGCFEQMQLEGFSPDAFTIACIFKACGSLGAADKGHTIHSQIVRESSLEEENMVANALVDMYAKCGELENAQKVFDELLSPDIVSWNALISGHVHYGQGEDALHCLERMKSEGCSPNAFTFACTLKACGGMQALGKGQELHAQIVKEHFLGQDVVANALTDMYAKCGEPERAQEVFDGLLVHDVISWNALITGYAQHKHSEKVLKCFDQMQSAGSLPNAITFACNLKACGSIRALQKGQQLHAQIVGEPLLVEDVVVGTALVDMYARCGVMETAEKVFNELPSRDVISWNVLITGYTQNNCAEEALSSFERMRLEGFSSDAATYSCILKACGSLGGALKGQKLHAEVVIFGALEESIMIGTALVVLYANCGMLREAQEIFDRLPVQDVVSWSGLMVGYAQLGKAKLVFSLFDKMVGEGIEPSMVTFTIVLNACSHGGLLVEGQLFFEYISKGFDIIPTLEHYTCMVNLFGCAGHLEKAVAIIERMPGLKDLTMWHSLLGVCERWGNANLGKWAFKHAVWLDDKDPAVYVCMSNIYAAARRQENACKAEDIRVKNHVWNMPVQSWNLVE